MPSPRTYLYKLTSDRGGAPCATPPAPGEDPILTLAICKPAIRRTAQVGDRILGITSHALANAEGYPLCAVIYAALVEEGIEARDYFAPASPFSQRPDCIYEFHQQNGRAAHTGRTNLHRSPANLLKDLGAYPYYRNGRVLLAQNFRYFGSAAVPIPRRLHLLYAAAETLEAADAPYPGRSGSRRLRPLSAGPASTRPIRGLPAAPAAIRGFAGTSAIRRSKPSGRPTSPSGFRSGR
jgi:hypothetical protein